MRSHPHCLLVVTGCATNSHRFDLRQFFIYIYIFHIYIYGIYIHTVTTVYISCCCVLPVSSSWFLPPRRCTNKTCFTLKPSCSHRKIHAAFFVQHIKPVSVDTCVVVPSFTNGFYEPSFQFTELQPTAVNVWVCQPGESDFAEQSILKGFRGFERITYEMLVVFTSNILTRQMKMTFIIPRHGYRRLNHTSYSHTVHHIFMVMFTVWHIIHHAFMLFTVGNAMMAWLCRYAMANWKTSRCFRFWRPVAFAKVSEIPINPCL